MAKLVRVHGAAYYHEQTGITPVSFCKRLWELLHEEDGCILHIVLSSRGLDIYIYIYIYIYPSSRIYGVLCVSCSAILRT